MKIALLLNAEDYSVGIELKERWRLGLYKLEKP